MRHKKMKKMKKIALALILFQLIGCAKQPVPVINIYPDTEIYRQQINDQIMITKEMGKELMKFLYTGTTGILILMGLQLAELTGMLSRTQAFASTVLLSAAAILRGLTLEATIVNVYSKKEKEGESKCKHTTTK
jgi:hypothetical protein